MEEETIGSQGLFQSSFLKQLVLDTLEWKGALLLKALAEDDVNRSIECLRLEDPGRLWRKRNLEAAEFDRRFLRSISAFDNSCSCPRFPISAFRQLSKVGHAKHDLEKYNH
ncbi:hypothetical protein AXG93_3036s1360 [Marchantia polymorpha subsp. ruderalis]|uniref:Uncharacterized protein n=1 Tax=Marchantia polymorpha subsp. ruderalis TaxID=1480154 RepID=A0A176W7P6_MARPO|nr:hypothetical protein AXG93_3036s1360 [Marchantia polymorpha subsp. ruderalis]